MRKIIGKLTQELSNHTNPKDVGKDNGYFVKTFRELIEHIAKLSFNNKDYLLFFRGQKSDYRNKVNNSTFYPSIYRGEYLTQEELNFRFDKLSSASKILIKLFNENNIEGQNELKRKKYIQWSILQHYEVTETPLLDLTQSIRVACSFAQLNNNEVTGFVYVFGLPYLTNRISINSEHDLVNIRLLSITPPRALRPYFQEGFLVGTADITNEYDDKTELDFNNRLIAKFEIPTDRKFWQNNFNKIPESALFPRNDFICKISQEIKQELKTDVAPANLGKFLQLWSMLENKILNDARIYKRDVHNLRNAIKILMIKEENKYPILKKFDYLRAIRNKIVHSPTSVSNEELYSIIQELETLLYTLNP